MSWLNYLVKRMFPDAQVERIAYEDSYRVSIVLTERELVRHMHPDDNIRATAERLWALRPKRVKRRRLHWGKKH